MTIMTSEQLQIMELQDLMHCSHGCILLVISQQKFTLQHTFLLFGDALGIEIPLEGVETVLEGVEAALEGLEAALEGVETALEGLEAAPEGVETALEGLASTCFLGLRLKLMYSPNTSNSSN